MKIENFLIDGNCSIKDALTKIDNNSFGIIFSQTKSGEVYGVATDGDIRRSLIAGLGLDDKIDKCINKEFHWEDNNVSREALIKKLDHQIKVIPILDSKMHLVDVITKENLPEI